MSAGVVVYREGLMCSSVCAPAEMTPEQVAEAVNQEHPTGISAPWAVSAETRFASGHPNPSPCDQNPETRKHWLLEC